MDKIYQVIPSFEITSTLQKASLFGGKVAQPTPTTRVITPIKQIEIDHYGTMFIELQEETPFEEGRPVLVNLNYRNISFHLDPKKYSMEGRVLVSQIPKDARAIKIRDNERYAFPLTSEVKTFIHRIERRGGDSDFSASLVDVSSRGLGLMLNNPDHDIITKNDHIWIKTINSHSLEKPIFGTIVYTYTKQFKDSQDIKAGVSLETELPEEIFVELTNLCRLVLKG